MHLPASNSALDEHGKAVNLHDLSLMDSVKKVRAALCEHAVESSMPATFKVRPKK